MVFILLIVPQTETMTINNLQANKSSVHAIAKYQWSSHDKVDVYHFNNVMESDESIDWLIDSRIE
jgi:hypothetical protein